MVPVDNFLYKTKDPFRGQLLSLLESILYNLTYEIARAIRTGFLI